MRRLSEQGLATIIVVVCLLMAACGPRIAPAHSRAIVVGQVHVSGAAKLGVVLFTAPALLPRAPDTVRADTLFIGRVRPGRTVLAFLKHDLSFVESPAFLVGFHLTLASAGCYWFGELQVRYSGRGEVWVEHVAAAAPGNLERTARDYACRSPVTVRPDMRNPIVPVAVSVLPFEPIRK